MKKLIALSSWLIVILGLAFNCYAEEIAIFYTGDTHAMLYTCSCPIETDGGVARRATLLGELRKEFPNSLVLDSGSFFPGGQMDEFTQDTELDMRRARINLKAMEIMNYDAVNIGDDEFNFGKKFLEENIAGTNLKFLSSNLSIPGVSPYVIRQVGGINVGIIGVISPRVAQKAQGLVINEPKAAVSAALAQSKKEGAELIVLLSHLSDADNSKLINDVAGIDIIISGNSLQKDAASKKINGTLVVGPNWQGRKLGKLILTVKDKKITDHKLEELRLSDKISDNKDILNILPRCFSDINCKKDGFIGACQSPASKDANCVFSQSTRIPLTVITAKACTVCMPEEFIGYLKKQFPGLNVSYVDSRDAKARKIIRDFNITGLPAYLLGKEVEGEKNFDSFKNNLEKKNDFYLVKPQFSGVSYFLNREKRKGQLELFISLYDKNAASTLEVLREFDPEVHFLAIYQNDKFDAAGGNLEAEDYLRAVCVKKYYPQAFWDYISCRAKDFMSSWWENCSAGTDINKIRSCATGPEGIALLKENISLNNELNVMFGPVYLKDNQEIFSTKEVPKKEELRAIIKR